MKPRSPKNRRASSPACAKRKPPMRGSLPRIVPNSNKVGRRRVERFETVDSTMTIAARLAREGCEHGTVVTAEEQTSGIGRHGHSWHSERGTGLYVSIVLRITRPAPVTMLALGLAAR